MDKCAILGGIPVRDMPIPWVSTMGEEETDAVLEVMRTGILSDFVAGSGERSYGGPQVREIEEAFSIRFGSKYAISVNSATTALHAAIAACGIGPGDEVIVSPYTMTATASAILMNCAVPIFADIDPDIYSIIPHSIESLITSRTKAILTVNIFGLPGYLQSIRDLADKYGLFMIEDNSQSPGATICGKEAGTFGDIGVFSLNYHKVIHSGEGGMILTDDESLASRCRLIRNHGELALDQMGDMETVALGSNIRMSELHAAIGLEQLKKLDEFLKKRRFLGDLVTRELAKRKGLKGVIIPEGYTHSYYVYPMKYDRKEWGMSRSLFAKAMSAEGFPLAEGYVKPIYLMNLYRHKHVFNNTTYPFAFIDSLGQDYKMGICPIAEKMYFEELLIADVCREPYSEDDIDDFFSAIDKIWENKDDIIKEHT